MTVFKFSSTRFIRRHKIFSRGMGAHPRIKFGQISINDQDSTTGVGNFFNCCFLAGGRFFTRRFCFNAKEVPVNAHQIVQGWSAKAHLHCHKFIYMRPWDSALLTFALTRPSGVI